MEGADEYRRRDLEAERKKTADRTKLLLGISAACFLLVLFIGTVLIYANTCVFGHRWAEATCESPKTCKKCGRTRGAELGHDWSDATCSAPATCARCGLTKGTKLAHRWTEATCDTPMTCEVCGETQGEAKGHDIDKNVIVIDEPTCTENGTGYTVCRVCGSQFPEAIPAKGHDYDENSVLVSAEATCTEDGVSYKTCKICDKQEEFIIPAKGHRAGEWKENGDGEKALYCAVCGEVTDTAEYDPEAEKAVSITLISCEQTKDGHYSIKYSAQNNTDSDKTVKTKVSVCGNDEAALASADDTFALAANETTQCSAVVDYADWAPKYRVTVIEAK